jgi:hypothetical protein
MTRPLDPRPAGFPAGIRRRSLALRAPGADAAPRREGGLWALVRLAIQRMAWLAAAAILVAHILFAVDEHPFAVRVLTAVPAILLVFEMQAFLSREERELPFVILGLLQFYMTFGFGVFFNLPFFDLNGPVNFSTEARVSAGLAVAFGALTVSLGARLGKRLVTGLEQPFTRVLPPSELPSGWPKAFRVFAAASVAYTLVSIFAPQLIPGSVALPASLAFALPMAVGLALALPKRSDTDLWSKLLLAVGVATGFMRGELDPIFRIGIAYVSAGWAVTRRVSIQVVAAVAFVFIIVQPVKHTYREQIWGKGMQQTATVEQRVDAWTSAFDKYFDRDNHSRSVDDTSAVDRLSELNAVEHAFDVVPGRVSYIWGESLLEVVYSPIPRFIWPDKPATKDSTTQRYAILFGRQTERGARSTAINLPLLVEGYWNFGWPGIILVCAAIGLLLGLSQRLLSGGHWALRAIGVANISGLAVGGAVVGVYSSIFQTMTARVGMCWLVFWLASGLSNDRRRSPIALRARRAEPLPSR